MEFGVYCGFVVLRDTEGVPVVIYDGPAYVAALTPVAAYAELRSVFGPELFEFDEYKLVVGRIAFTEFLSDI